ncbi:MAG: V-type ATP synthase subunit D [Nitrospinota bacterium]
MLLRVNPNRMELLRLRRRLAAARRGHKLLKDKLEALIQDFILQVKEAVRVRGEVEEELGAAYHTFLLATAPMSSSSLEAALLTPGARAELEVKTANIMSVAVPQFQLRQEGSIYPYGFYGTAAELDAALRSFQGLLPKIVQLAQLEKATELMAEEIQRTRRRVNALEYVLIPSLEATVKHITMKLDEMARSTASALMRIKEQIRRT